MTVQVHALNHLKRCRGGKFAPNLKAYKAHCVEIYFLYYFAGINYVDTLRRKDFP